jgi:hypothetical protein
MKLFCNEYPEKKARKAMLMKTVKDEDTLFKTVGWIFDRYRLVHRWVPEMVLNVQSDFREESSSILLPRFYVIKASFLK